MVIDTFILYHHLGLGDHFVCNGLVHYVSKNANVTLICKKQHVECISHLYEDFKNITIYPIEKEPDDVFKLSQDTQIPILRVGFENTDLNSFEKSFYYQLNIPFEVKNEYFTLPSNLSKSNKFYNKVKNDLGEDYIFVHNESTAGVYDLAIDSPLPKFFVRKEDTKDILDYIHTICFAKEIHFINSGLFPLIVGLLYQNKIKTDKVFFHNTRKLSEGGLHIELPENIIRINYE
jgi:hypothetical protein